MPITETIIEVVISNGTYSVTVQQESEGVWGLYNLEDLPTYKLTQGLFPDGFYAERGDTYHDAVRAARALMTTEDTLAYLATYCKREMALLRDQTKKAA